MTNHHREIVERLQAELTAERERADKAEAEARELREAAELVVTTFERDISQGYKTKDKEFVIEILRRAILSRAAK